MQVRCYCSIQETCLWQLLYLVSSSTATGFSTSACLFLVSETQGIF